MGPVEDLSVQNFNFYHLKGQTYYFFKLKTFTPKMI